MVNSLLGERRTSANWTTIQVEVGQQRPGFTVDIGVATAHRQGQLFRDVALDNVQLINCDPSKAAVNNGSGKLPVSCSFDSDQNPLCGWEVTGVSGARSRWERTNSISRQPGIDHTSLIVPKPKLFGSWLSSQASLDGAYETDVLVTSVPLKANTLYCFSFWYFFFGLELDSSLALYASKQAKAVESLEKHKDIYK